MRVSAAAAGALLLLMLHTGIEAQGVESLTVTLVPGAVNFTLTTNSNTNAGDVPITALTSWSLLPVRTSLTLDAYFASASAALVHAAAANTVDIPSARIEVSVNGGPRGPFDETVGFGAPAAGRRIFSQPITAVTLTGSRSDTLALNINLSGYPLPADTYTGSLRVRASATP